MQCHDAVFLSLFATIAINIAAKEEGFGFIKEARHFLFGTLSAGLLHSTSSGSSNSRTLTVPECFREDSYCKTGHISSTWQLVSSCRSMSKEAVIRRLVSAAKAVNEKGLGKVDDFAEVVAELQQSGQFDKKLHDSLDACEQCHVWFAMGTLFFYRGQFEEALRHARLAANFAEAQKLTAIRSMGNCVGVGSVIHGGMYQHLGEWRYQDEKVPTPWARFAARIETDFAPLDTCSLFYHAVADIREILRLIHRVDFTLLVDVRPCVARVTKMMIEAVGKKFPKMTTLDRHRRCLEQHAVVDGLKLSIDQQIFESRDVLTKAKEVSPAWTFLSLDSPDERFRLGQIAALLARMLRMQCKIALGEDIMVDSEEMLRHLTDADQRGGADEAFLWPIGFTIPMLSLTLRTREKAIQGLVKSMLMLAVRHGAKLGEKNPELSAESAKIERVISAVNEAREWKSKGNEAVKQATSLNGDAKTAKLSEAANLYSKGIDLRIANHCIHDANRTLLAQLYCNRAKCYFDTGDLEKSLDDAQCASAVSPPYSKAVYRCGQCYMGLGQYSNAVTVLEKGMADEKPGSSFHREMAAMKAECEALAKRADGNGNGNQRIDHSSDNIGIDEDEEAEEEAIALLVPCTEDEEELVALERLELEMMADMDAKSKVKDTLAAELRNVLAEKKRVDTEITAKRQQVAQKEKKLQSTRDTIKKEQAKSAQQRDAELKALTNEVNEEKKKSQSSKKKLADMAKPSSNDELKALMKQLAQAEAELGQLDGKLDGEEDALIVLRRQAEEAEASVPAMPPAPKPLPKASSKNASNGGTKPGSNNNGSGASQPPPPAYSANPSSKHPIARPRSAQKTNVAPMSDSGSDESGLGAHAGSAVVSTPAAGVWAKKSGGKGGKGETAPLVDLQELAAEQESSPSSSSSKKASKRQQKKAQATASKSAAVPEPKSASLVPAPRSKQH